MYSYIPTYMQFVQHHIPHPGSLQEEKEEAAKLYEESSSPSISDIKLLRTLLIIVAPPSPPIKFHKLQPIK
jgi:hypothetical protein